MPRRSPGRRTTALPTPPSPRTGPWKARRMMARLPRRPLLLPRPFRRAPASRPVTHTHTHTHRVSRGKIYERQQGDREKRENILRHHSSSSGGSGAAAAATVGRQSDIFLYFLSPSTRFCIHHGSTRNIQRRDRCLVSCAALLLLCVGIVAWHPAREVVRVSAVLETISMPTGLESASCHQSTLRAHPAINLRLHTLIATIINFCMYQPQLQQQQITEHEQRRDHQRDNNNKYGRNNNSSRGNKKQKQEEPQ